jgi:uncharacterized membrane protein YphA (DoxX/SURF4 family)
MQSFVLLVRAALAAVFLVAALGKLLDLPGSRRALAGFGVPEPAAKLAGALLPFAELAVALALIFRPSARWGAAAAAILLLIFVAGIANALARGQQPDCHCLGAIHSAPVSRTQLILDSALAGLGIAAAIAGPGPAIDGWFQARTGFQLATIGLSGLAVLVVPFAVKTWTEVRRLRTYSAEARDTIAAIPPGLPIGTQAPPFEIADLDGATLSLHELCSARKPVALMFVSPGSGPSQALVPEFDRWKKLMSDHLTIGVVGRGIMLRYDLATDRYGRDVVFDRDPVLSQDVDDLFELMTLYRIKATPSAVIVSSAGTVLSASVDGRPAIEALLRLTLAEARPVVHDDATASLRTSVPVAPVEAVTHG